MIKKLSIFLLKNSSHSVIFDLYNTMVMTSMTQFIQTNLHTEDRIIITIINKILKAKRE